MTAETVIAEIKTLPAAERAKVFAYVNHPMASDDCGFRDRSAKPSLTPTRDGWPTWKLCCAEPSRLRAGT